MNNFKVGLVDSGYSSNSEGNFIKKSNNKVSLEPLKDDSLGHGTALCEVIGDEYCQIIHAQIFHKELITCAETVAAAILYLIEKKVNLIHMSLGLKSDREVLRNAIKKAQSKGIIIVASAPTLSNEVVYPSSYSNVISVCADIRCQKDMFSYINTSFANFGASPFSNYINIGGSSVAAAYITRKIAYLYSIGIKTISEQLKALKNSADFKVSQPMLSKKGIL